LTTLSFSIGAHAATTAEINAARAKGLAWMMTNQNGDGAWKSRPGAEIAATAEAMEALRNAGVSGPSYSLGLSRLSNARAHSIDALSRKITALTPAGMNVAPHLNTLIQWRNTALTWGAYDQYETSFPDTPLALGAFRINGYPGFSVNDILTPLICHMLPAQQTDGSWSFIAPNTTTPVSITGGRILPTVQNILEINGILAAMGQPGASCVGSNDLQAAIDNGINWLLTKQLGDGGFGDDGSSTVLETALAYEVLKDHRATDPATGAALDYLIAQQNSVDGSWQGDPFATAKVLKNFPATTLPDTDNDGVPDAVETILGTDPFFADSDWLFDGNGESTTGVTTTVLLAEGILYQAFAISLSTSGGTPPFSWAITSGALPGGLSLEGTTGLISGTPTMAGNYHFTYAVSDATSTSTSVGTIKIVPAIREDWVARHAGPADSENTDWKVVTDSAGNAYVAGTRFNGIDDDFVTIKYAPDGSELWSKTYDFLGDDSAVALALDAAQSVVYVAGKSRNATDNDYALLKYDANGNVVWADAARYDAGGEDIPAGLVVDSAGNIYVTGRSFVVANDNYATVKYAADGSQQWVRTYDFGGNDDAVAVALDGSGRVVVTGTSFNGANNDYATLRYTPSGTETLIGRYDSGADDVAVDLAVGAFDDIVITGSRFNGSNKDYSTIKYNASGLTWVKTYDNGGDDIPVAIAVAVSGNVYWTGSSWNGSNYDYFTLKYSPDATQAWSQRFDSGSEDLATNLALDGSENVYVTGSTCTALDTLGICSDRDMLTVKYDFSLAEIAQVQYDSGINDAPVAMTLDPSGNLFVLGFSDGDITLSRYEQLDLSPPAVPSNLKKTYTSLDRIDFVWTASTDNVGVSGYEVERCEGIDCTDFVSVATVVNASYSDTGLSKDTPYRYRVRAFDALGNYSGYSSIATIETIGLDWLPAVLYLLLN